MKKIILAIITLVVLWWVGLYFYMSQNAWLSSVDANPDYICKKAVVDSPCEVKTCDPWKTDGTRVCNWVKITEVSYYLIRTDCEAGYTKVSAWWNPGWASGRQWADYVSWWTESCTIVEVDNVPPIWDISE